MCQLARAGDVGARRLVAALPSDSVSDPYEKACGRANKRKLHLLLSANTSYQHLLAG